MRNISRHSSHRRLELFGIVCAILFGTNCASAGTFLSQDFEAANVAETAKITSTPTGGSATAAASLTDDGTIDTYLGKPGHCVTLKATLPPGNGVATVSIVCPSEPGSIADLARLTLSADLWVDHSRPVTVRIASTDLAGHPSGTLTGTFYPPVTGAWYRHEVALSAMKQTGGRFDPLAGKFIISFELSSEAATTAVSTLRVDNLSLSSPSFYIGPRGNDAGDGRTEKSAFKTVQRGIDAAAAGDVVMIMGGTYRNTNAGGVARIAKSGTVAKWITLCNYPGQKAVLSNDGWEVIKVVPGSAYLEFRGLEIAGNAGSVKLADALKDGLIKQRDGKEYFGDPKYNGNGISVDGRDAATPELRPHHIRLIRNDVHDNCGCGLSGLSADYCTFEGNIVSHNVHYMRFGGSGISVLTASNFDTSTTYHTFVLRNVLRDNGCYVPWIDVGHMSDGNGIIIDTCIDKDHPENSHVGRFLIANNLCIGSGGGGITVTTSAHVDIINNTLYHNVQTPYLAKEGWGDLFLGGPMPSSHDVRVFNNIIWAAPGRGILGTFAMHDWTSGNNIYFGETGAKIEKGDAGDAENLFADPKLKKPSLTASIDDFAPTSASPALGHGSAAHTGAPLTDLDNTNRTAGPSVTAGAIQKP